MQPRGHPLFGYRALAVVGAGTGCDTVGDTALVFGEQLAAGPAAPTRGELRPLRVQGGCAPTVVRASA
jgi:hypothetical protein